MIFRLLTARMSASYWLVIVRSIGRDVERIKYPREPRPYEMGVLGMGIRCTWHSAGVHRRMS